MSRAAHAAGADMLTAIAIAYEIFCRINESVMWRKPWTLDTGYSIALGATGGICHLLGMSRQETTHAVSFAAVNGVPLRAARYPTTKAPPRPFHHGMQSFAHTWPGRA